MDSPVLYILISMVFTSAALSIIFLMAWRNLGRKSYALTWACAFAVATLQWTLYLTSNWFSNPAAHWLLISLLAIMMMTLNLRGHCQRTDCGLLPTNLWPYAGALFFVILWTTVIDRHAGLSTMLVPAAAAMSFLLSAWIIVRHREQTRPAEWAAAISLALFALSQLVAAGIALGQGTGIEAGYQNLFMHYNFITLPTGYLATSMFVVFMVASDISEEMKEIAVRDELTGLYNRRGLSEHGAQAYAAANRGDRPISVVMTDIDRFKFINDKYGHAAGDDALCHIAELLRDGRREDDVLARVGGEEFVVVLPGADMASAIEIADKLRREIESSSLVADGDKVSMTSSFGVATRTDRDSCLTDIIVRADRALYRSKRAGRNQVDLESSQMMLAEDGSLQPISSG